MEVKQHRNRVVRTAMNADDVPRECCGECDPCSKCWDREAK